MKAHRQIIGMIGLALTTISVAKAQEVTSSFVDDLNGKKEDKASLTFNKKVKLTNAENGKTVVVRINDRIQTENNNKVAVLSKNDETGNLKSKKAKVTIKEMEADGGEIERFWATADASASKDMNSSPAFKAATRHKEIEIETTKIEGFEVNHVYDLKGNQKELNGYGLQLAAFTQLKTAKEYAEKMTQKGEAESGKIFIQVSKAEDKPMVYRVLYGFFESETGAKENQKKMANLGVDALVKGFK